MSIDRVSLRLQSEALAATALSDLVGRSPTRLTERGTPVSARRPGGPTHSVSTAVFEVRGDFRDLDAYVDALGEAFAHIVSSRGDVGEFSADLVIAISSRPLGFVVELGVAQVSALARVQCGIVLDAYSSSAEGSESEG